VRKRSQTGIIVVGGGHNGLVAAGLLARRGRQVTVLERRAKVGGAAITEQPWGPDYKVTALSYVVSLMPPRVLEELELARHGYKIYPQHPYFVPYLDGRSLRMFDDPARRHAEISKFSSKDADAPVARILTDEDQVLGVELEDGERIDAPVVISTAHPQITFLRLLDPAALPEELVAAVERWKTRSGTVKVNLALDRLPGFTSAPGVDPTVQGGTIVLAESLDEIEHAFQDAVAGRPAARPFADICIPSVFDPTLAPPGKHVMSMFTQWVPHRFAAEPHRAELDAYADRVIARVEELAPGFTSSILHRQVIGPWEMEHEYGLIGGNIFHGELSLGQLFHMRPAPGWADFRTPVRGLYLAGSATHGGGGVTAIPALQVVKAILEDRYR